MTDAADLPLVFARRIAGAYGRYCGLSIRMSTHAASVNEYDWARLAGHFGRLALPAIAFKRQTMKVMLQTRDRELVHEADIPIVDQSPDVIVWNGRVFKRAELYGPEDAPRAVYVEAQFAYTLETP